MADIVTREVGATAKGSPLTNTEVDNNFINLNIGKTEKYIPIKNDTGSTLNKGEVVYITGSTGTNITVQRASAASEIASSKTFALVAATILANETGPAIRDEFLDDIDTSALTEGAALWLSATPGGLTSVKPAAPNHAVFLGYVVRQHASAGRLLIKVINGYEIEELHNVKATGVVNGDGYVYDAATQLYINKPVALKSDAVAMAIALG